MYANFWQTVTVLAELKNRGTRLYSTCKTFANTYVIIADWLIIGISAEWSESNQTLQIQGLLIQEGNEQPWGTCAPLLTLEMGRMQRPSQVQNQVKRLREGRPSGKNNKAVFLVAFLLPAVCQ